MKRNSPTTSKRPLSNGTITTPQRRLLLLALIALSTLLLWRQSPAIVSGANSASAELADVRERVMARNSYSFSSDITQITIPEATLENLGNTSSEERIYLTGDTNLSEQEMHMTLRSDAWQEGGSVLVPHSGVEIEMVDGQTRARQAQGEWETLDGFTDAFAPQGDFMSFLVASADVTAHDPESRNGIDFTRYTFEIDGVAFADYSREQMQATMQANGELPAGAVLQASPTYAGMTGDGELWIASNGLPLRQILDLQFPAANGAQTAARIQTDFSEYAEASGGFAWNSAEITSLFSSLEIPLIQLSSVTLFIASLYFFQRSRKFEEAIAWVLVASMVLTPVLQVVAPTRSVHAQTSNQAQGGDEEEISAEDQEQEQIDAIKKLYEEPDFDPQADPFAPDAPSPLDAPLEVAEDGTPLSIADGLAIENERAVLDTDTDGLSDAVEIALGTFVGVNDTDNDGLDDFQEVSLGTDPRTEDTDGDRLTDKEELVGYVYNGITWRLDPNNADSNGDGLTDSQELGPDVNNDGFPDSLYNRDAGLVDGDMIPDIYDDDNDGDGVPDHIDASPLERLGNITAFSRNNPFELSVSNLVAGRDATVDIQLRPIDTSHLWYAFNVLDWPLDRQGQVQDWDGGTFADNNSADGLTPPEDQSHGDMRLIPMLEVQIPDNGNPNVPSASTIHAYTQTLLTAAATMNTLTSNGLVTGTVTGRVIYAPLSLVNNAKTGERVAFSARLPLLTAESWGSDYQMRVVWIVQALMDSCEKRFESGPNKGECEIFSARNQPSPLHTYDESFEITGLNIREDVSARTAIIFEDPTVDPDINDDAALWSLSDNLDQTFLAGRTSTNGELDITVAEIGRRFDHRTNTDGQGIDSTDTERWDIPNYMAVESGSDLEFSNFAESVASLTMTRTHQVMSEHFNSSWQSNASIMPMLMYASENTYRSVSLDELDLGSAATSLVGDKLTVNFAPSGTALLPTTTNNLKWSHYCGSAGTTAEKPVVWVDCATEDVWDLLESRYKAGIDSSASSPDVALGELTLLKLYWTGLAKGVSSVVYSNGRPQNGGGIVSDETLKSNLTLGATQVGNKIAGLFQFKEDAMKTLGRVWHSKVFKANRVTATSQLTNITGKIASLWSKDPGITKWVKAKNAAQLIVLVAAVALFVVANVIWPSHPATKMATKLVAIAASIALGTIAPIVSAVRWSTTLISTAAAAGQTLSRTAALKQVMSGSSGLLANTKLANMIGATLVIAIAWSFFIASIINNGVEFGSAEFNQGAASMIATSLVIYALAVLAGNPYGLAAIALLTLIDGILLIVCAIKGEDDCTTVTGEVTKFIAKQVYSYDLMIEIDSTKNPDLRKFGAPELDLVNPMAGFIDDAQFTLGLPITTSIKSREPDSADWKIAVYQAYFNRSNFKSATFLYAMNDALDEDNPSLNADRDDDPGAWRGVYSHDNYLFASLYTGYKVDKPSISDIRRPAGINAAFDYNFNSAYAIPAYECWLIPNPKALLLPFPLCYVRTKEGSDSSFTKGPVRDLFPATIDDFMEMTATGQGGYRLAWDSSFPTVYDADGDGVVTSELVSGGDPSDALWDSDYDGVSDFIELKHRSNGIDFSPILCDSDNDGLTDKQEILYGTHPLRKDTDNDGVEDGDEVYHPVYTCQADAPPIHVPGDYAGGMQMRVAPFGELLTETNPSNATIIVTISSDPTERDADNDSIPDSSEYLLNQKGERDKNGHPYNPTVANVPPLTLYADLESSGGFARPGQSLAYSATVTADTDFQSGVLEIHEPAALGDGVPETYALPAFNAGSSSTINATYTVAPLANSGTVTVTSSASTRPTPTGNIPLWEWETPNVGSVNAASDNRGVSTSWVDSSAVRNYMFSSVIADADDDSRGEVRVSNVPSGNFNTTSINSGEYERSQAAPDITCNDSGICFTVWDERDVCTTFTIKRLYVGEDEESNGHYGIEPTITLEPAISPNAPAGPYEFLWNYSYQYNIDQLREGSWYPLTTAGGSPVTHTYCQGENEAGHYLKVYEADATAFSDPQTGETHLIHPDLDGSYQWAYGDSFGIQLDVEFAPIQRNRVKGRFVNSDGIPVSSTTFTIYDGFDDGTNNTLRGHFFPSVATNGDNFLVAWNYKDVSSSYTAGNTHVDITVNSYIETQLMSVSGSKIGTSQSFLASPYNAYTYDESTLTLGPTWRETAFGKTDADVVPQVVWAGDRYVVAWHSKNGAAHKLESVDVSGLDGKRIAGTQRQISAEVDTYVANRRFPPQMAYDPVNERILYVYLSDSQVLTGKLYVPGQNTAEVTRAPLATTGNYADSPAVAYYPPTGGWMVSWGFMTGYGSATSATGSGHVVYAALNADATVFMQGGPTTPTFNGFYDTTRSLSCASPISEPLAVYDFEELPGETQFANGIGSFAGLFCVSEASCPIAGVSGAADKVKPYSDRALYFDGAGDRLQYDSTTRIVDEDFSVAFWMKTDGSTSGTTMLNSHSLFRTLNGPSALGISVGSGGVLKVGVGSNYGNAAVVGDGEWHHVALSRKEESGNVLVYVDAMLVGFNSWADESISLNTGFSIGGYFTSPTLDYRGWLDDFRIYENVLSAETVSEMYNLTQRSACVVAAPSSNSTTFYEIGLERQDPRGDAQPIVQTSFANLTIDADAPVSTLEAITTTARSRAAATRYVQVPAGGMVTQIIGGSSEDGAGSGVASVSVTVDGGTPVLANGTAQWVYAMLLSEGAHTVAVAATDAVGNVESPGATITIVGDATPPTVDFDPLPTNLNPPRDSDGNYLVALSGLVEDAASGVRGRFVDLKLVGTDGTSYGWQNTYTGVDTTDVEVYYYHEYVLPAGIGDPTGLYTLTARVVDGVGNSAEYSQPISLAIPKFEVRVSDEDAGLRVVTDTNTIINGVVTSTQTISSVEATFVPIEQLAVLSGTVVSLDLSNPNNDAWAEDGSDNGNDAFCTTTCPYTSPSRMAGESGTNFDGQSAFFIPHSEELSTANDRSFAVQAWVKTTTTGDDIFSKLENGTGNQSGIEMRIRSNGMLELRKYSDTIVQAASGVITDGEWHLVTANIDRVNNLNQIYVDGVLVGEKSGLYAMANTAPIMVGGQDANPHGFVGYMDEFTVWNRALAADEVATTYAMRNPDWQPASIVNRSSRGVAGESAEWQLPVPANTEGYHRIDVRITDNDGNRYRAASDWQTIIDTLAPRVVIDEENTFATGATFYDALSDAIQWEVKYSVTATDTHLSESSFASICTGNTVADRGYITDDGSSWPDMLFPDVTWRNTLDFSCNVWAAGNTPSFDATVCDIYGNCTTVSQVVDGSDITHDRRPVIIAPASGSVVDGSNLPRSQGRDGQMNVSINIGVVAQSETAIQKLDIFHGTSLVKTLTYPQELNADHIVTYPTINLPGEGIYDLSIVLTNWDGSTGDSPPMSFTLDTERPSGTLNVDALTEADTLAVGSGILRFSGLVIDTLEVATVQLSVNGEPFEDVTLNDDESWHGAVYVGEDIYEEWITVTVRFIDKAGAIGTITESIYVDIEEPSDAVPTALALTEMQAAPATGAVVTWIMVIVLLAVTMIFRPKKKR